MNDVCRDQLITALKLFDGLSIIFFDVGDKHYKLNGPSVIYSNGNKEWLIDNDIYHRGDGLAIVCCTCYRGWWVNNKLIKGTKYGLFL